MITILEWLFNLIGPVAFLIAVLAAQRAARLEATIGNLQREHYRMAEQVQRLTRETPYR